MRRIAVLVSAVLMAASGPRAAADEIANRPSPVEWQEKWSRFRLWEYGATAVFGGASLYLYRYRPPPDQPRWQGSNVFDDEIRGWLRASTRPARERAGIVGDVLWLGLVTALFF